MIQFILQDDSMPRTVFWQEVLDALGRASSAAPDLAVPLEDTAIETNWPKYGNPAGAYLRGHTHELGEGKTVSNYLKKIIAHASANPATRVLLLNMHPFFRIPQFLRGEPNIVVADGSLIEFERQLNPRTVSFPALPISTGKPTSLESRKILASFRGVASHPVRKALAAIADGNQIVVEFVERSNHVGKIDALTARNSHCVSESTTVPTIIQRWYWPPCT